MSRFLKVFLRDPLSARIQVAGFGKHPAWDDHIDDIGLNTESLVLTPSSFQKSVAIGADQRD